MATTDDLPSIDVRAVDLLPGVTGAVLTVDGRAEVVGIVWRPQPFGGCVAFWRCPCGRVCRRLYVGAAEGDPPSPALACRRCHGLRFPVTIERDDVRAWRRLARIRHRLGWGGGILPGTKPARMTWATFERLTAEHVTAVAEVVRLTGAPKRRQAHARENCP